MQNQKRRGRKKLTDSSFDLVNIKEEPNIMEPSSILLSLGLNPPSNFTSSEISSNYNQENELLNQQKADSDLQLDIFQDMFLFSPFENFDTFKQLPFISNETISNSIGQPEKNETPSTFSRPEYYNKMKETFQRRLPDKMLVVEKALNFRQQLVKIRESLTEDAVLSMRRDFDTYLTTFSAVFDQLGIPSLIWERCCVIHYISKGYNELTGFNNPLPTAIEDMAFTEQLSTDGFRGYVDGLAKVFLITGSSVNHFTFATGVKVVGSSNYIEGTMCVTIKRDMIGLPLIFIGNFLPLK